MALMDAFRGTPDTKPEEIPSVVKTRTGRGRRDMLRDASKRRLCMKFEKGETYWFLNDKSQLGAQSTAQFAIPGQGKPPHRIRNTYNFIRPIVAGKVSAASQRMPSYEILPSTTDPEDIGAARLAEKVAVYGYDKWRLRKVTVKTMTLAIGGGGDGFAMPYFDQNVGPYLTPPINPETGMPDGEPVGEGEIKVLVLNGNEVYWEPGVDFYESRWHCIERATPIEDIMELPGFFGDALVPDASTSDIPTDRSQNDNLAMLSKYFERPCPKYPEGRLFTMANGRVIVDYRRIESDALSSWEPYPLIDTDGNAIDEPVLHRLQWNIDVDNDRDFGLTWQLIDAQRTIQDCWNKLLELKNRALNLRIMAPRGSNMSPRVDEPGGIDYYDLQGNGTVTPQYENVSNAIAIAGPLFDMLNKMQADMRELGFDTQLAAEANVAARTVSAVIEQYQAKWQSFLGDTADWHSRLMRHCLLLVARHYSEQRKLAIRGRFGPETIADFDGSQLMGQIDVRVLPGSLEYITRDQIVQRVFAYADRQWISPQQAMIAISSGTADVLVQSLELDLARVDRIIQKIRDGSVMDMPARVPSQPPVDPMTGQVIIDPETGQPPLEPSWMPLDMVDDLDVWKARITDWMKTSEFDDLPPQLQEVGKLIIEAIDRLKTQQQQRAIEAQNAQAAQLGLNNASKPQQAKPSPDQASPGPAPDAAPDAPPPAQG